MYACMHEYKLYVCMYVYYVCKFACRAMYLCIIKTCTHVNLYVYLFKTGHEGRALIHM